MTAQPFYPSFHGSYVIAMVGKDGIMVASDSRCTFPYVTKDSERIHLAYYDLTQKIYILGKNALAVSGQFSIGNVFISTMINEYRSSMQADTLQVKNLVSGFLQFCKTKYSRVFNQVLADYTTLYAAGYDNDKPRIFVYTKQMNGIKEMPPGFVAESGKSTFTAYAKNTDLCKDLAPKAEKAIAEYVAENHKEETIGGPIAVALVNKRGVVFVQNRPVDFKWATFRDFMEDCSKNKVPLHYTSPERKKLFEKVYIQKYIR